MAVLPLAPKIDDLTVGLRGSPARARLPRPVTRAQGSLNKLGGLVGLWLLASTHLSMDGT